MSGTIAIEMATTSDRRLGEGIAAILLGVCGPILFVTVPFFLTFVKEYRAFDASQVSLISSADMLGMFLASSLAAVWIRSANWRAMSIGSLALLIVATFGSIHAQSFAAFGLSRIAAGLGAGSLMGIGLTAMGERQRSDAWFGWFVAAQALLGTITSWAIPRFIQPYGLTGFLSALIAIYILLLPMALMIQPRSRGIAATTDGVTPKTGSLGYAILSLVAAFAFYMGIFAIWSNIDQIGRAGGIDPLSIGDALSVAFFLGIPASLAVVALSGRVSRNLLFVAIGAIDIGALLILTGPTGTFGFFAATLMLGWLWYFAAPPQMALTVSVDTSGRFVVLFVAAMKSSYVVAGAILAVLLANGGSLRRVLLFSGVCGLASLILYLFIGRRAGTILSPARS